jgi:hypothetical protein
VGLEAERPASTMLGEDALEASPSLVVLDEILDGETARKCLFVPAEQLGGGFSAQATEGLEAVFSFFVRPVEHRGCAPCTRLDVGLTTRESFIRRPLSWPGDPRETCALLHAVVQNREGESERDP